MNSKDAKRARDPVPVPMLSLFLRIVMSTPKGTVDNIVAMDDKPFVGEPNSALADQQCYDLCPENIGHALQGPPKGMHRKKNEEKILSLIDSDPAACLPSAGTQGFKLWSLRQGWSTLLIHNTGAAPVLFRQRQGDYRCRTLWPGDAMVFEPDHTIFYLFLSTEYNQDTYFEADRFAALRLGWARTRDADAMLKMQEHHFRLEAFPVEEDRRTNLSVSSGDASGPRPFCFEMVKTRRGFGMEDARIQSTLRRCAKLLPVLCIHLITGLVTIAYHPLAFTAQGINSAEEAYPNWYSHLCEHGLSTRIMQTVAEMVHKAAVAPWGTVQKRMALPPLIDFNAVVELFAKHVHSEFHDHGHIVKVSMKSRQFDQCVHIASFRPGNNNGKLHFVLQPFAVPEGVQITFTAGQGASSSSSPMELPGVLITLTDVLHDEITDHMAGAFPYNPAQGVHLAENILEKPVAAEATGKGAQVASSPNAPSPSTATNKRAAKAKKTTPIPPEGRVVQWESQEDTPADADLESQAGLDADGSPLKDVYVLLQGLQPYTDLVHHRMLLL